MKFFLPVVVRSKSVCCLRTKSIEITMTALKACPLLLLAFSLVSMGKECPFPELKGTVVLSAESILKNNFPDNSIASVECAKGYKKDDGPDSIICVNGVWSQPELICKKMDCGLPSPSPHMKYTINQGTLFGAYIQPRCEIGYDLEGSSHRQCLVFGWTGKAECILTECIVPDKFQHGQIYAPKKPLFNDVITFVCDDGYILVGNSSIKCVEYGEYDLEPPICKAIECPVLDIPFGNLTEGNPPFFYKSKAKFECWPGYSMKDSATAVCETSGWSPIPVCEVIITQTEASTTTNKPTTTDPTPTTHSLGGPNKEPATFFSLVWVLVIVIAVICICCLGYGYFVFCYSKHKGSNNRTAPLL